MLEVVNLNCGYGSFRAVHDLSFKVDTGGVFGLIGANGAGKTSTLMAIAGHVGIHSGSIVYNNNDITTLNAHDKIKLGIALVPEGRRLFPDLSARENLTIGGYSLPSARESTNEERVFSLFPRLTERLKQKAGSLSGGEQQMLAIARALMAEPKLLLVDELSLGLMPKIIDACYDALQKLRDQGVSIVLVEQSTDRIVEFADRLCVLESGKAVWQGDGAQARNDTDLVNTYLGLQSHAV